MTTFNTLIAVAVLYAAGLFLVAFWAERAAARGRAGWMRSPVIYTLSLSVYCTAWTFYGAVGFAARSGLEYLTIYLGPSLVMIGWLWILRKLVRIGRSQRVTSIADLISSRYGKSSFLAVLVTLIAVIGTTPYIALQLQSLTLSLNAFSESVGTQAERSGSVRFDFLIVGGLAFFTILFGTRNLDANERHHGVVTAIAVEAVVKLIALLTVGVFVVWWVAGGVGAVAQNIEASEISSWSSQPSRWTGITLLAAAAFLCLPRMFQVLVVENSAERHLATAAWAFPAYMLLMSLFVIPIAVTGLSIMPEGANPDLFVLTIPLSTGHTGLAMLAFIGGFSSATSMVIVASIALSTMVSNHIIIPLWLRLNGERASMSGDIRTIALLARRVSIAGIVFLGYAYFSFSGSGAALAAIGLISFAGVAQFLPAMLGGIFWRGATAVGAGAGLIIGFVVWAFTLLIPNLFAGAEWLAQWQAQGALGLGILRPGALFGLSGLDPLVHALIWSQALNTLAFLIGSLISTPSPLERLQGAEFVNVFAQSGQILGGSQSAVEVEDLLIMAQRLLGPGEAQAIFAAAAEEQGKRGGLPDANQRFISKLERELAGSVGAATAHAMVAQIVGRAGVSVEDLLAVADESAQMLEYSSQLEAKSAELTRTAAELRRANTQLTRLSAQKDAFLSQISHELRTPMTSIRAFSEILKEPELDAAERDKYASIVHGEAIRLTRLLDDLLDLSVLENGKVQLNIHTGTVRDLLDQSVAATMGAERDLIISRNRVAEDITLTSDLDRLRQVCINLIANAGKYCDASQPELEITAYERDGMIVMDFIDNGSGIPEEQRGVIFEKFSRANVDSGVPGAGLGLAICAEIMKRLDGSISHIPQTNGAHFRLRLPKEIASG